MPKPRPRRSRSMPRQSADSGFPRTVKAAARAELSPLISLGSHGYTSHDGYVRSPESNAKLIGPRKYQTYGELMRNIIVVGTGVRYYLNLANKPSWHFEPADETSEATEIADFFAEIIDDMRSPWRRVVRRLAMSKFLGFSLGVWTGKVRPDGKFGLLDIAARPQFTIEQFLEDADGYLDGFTQRIPSTGALVPLPRGRCVYMVDDALADSPEGTGLLRHVVTASERLTRYEQLEGYCYETDMRGIPIIHAPYGALDREVAGKRMTAEAAAAAVLPLTTFAENHIRGKNNALRLDSEPYKNGTDYTTVKKFHVELLRGDAAGQVPLRAAITSINHEIARVLDAEGLLIGEGSSGNRSTSGEKAARAQMNVEGMLAELAEVIRKDVIVPIGALNGWDPEILPWPHTDSLQMRDIEQVAVALRDLAAAGATLTRDDEAVGQLFDSLGLARLTLSGEIDDAMPEVRTGDEPPEPELDEIEDDLQEAA